MTQDPPATGEPFVLRLWRGIRDPIAYLTNLEAKFGDIVSLRQGRTCAIFSPAYIKHVLQENHPNYVKGARYQAALGPLTGNGLFTSEGPFWLRQRRLAQIAFQRAKMASFDPLMLECVSEMLDRWEVKAKRGEPVHLREELNDLTLRITLRILFSANAVEQMAALFEAVEEVNQDIKLEATFLPFHLPKSVPTPGRRRFARSLKVIDDFVYATIKGRRQRPDPGSDLVGLLVQAKDEKTGETMTDLQLRDELVTFLNAGHNTVTDAVLWTMVVLARHQEAKDRVCQEIGSGPLSAERAGAMPYLGRVFHESMRLYPPAWVIARSAIADDRLGPYRIPAGTMIVISPYVTHRSPRYWDRADVFDPDRFLPDRSASRQKFAYFPFGGGPRLCIGSPVAMMEAPLILASILQRFDFELVSSDEIRSAPRISLRPDRVVQLRLSVKRS